MCHSTKRRAPLPASPKVAAFLVICRLSVFPDCQEDWITCLSFSVRPFTCPSLFLYSKSRYRSFQAIKKRPEAHDVCYSGMCWWQQPKLVCFYSFPVYWKPFCCADSGGTLTYETPYSGEAEPLFVKPWTCSQSLLRQQATR